MFRSSVGGVHFASLSCYMPGSVKFLRHSVDVRSYVYFVENLPVEVGAQTVFARTERPPRIGQQNLAPVLVLFGSGGGSGSKGFFEPP